MREDKLRLDKWLWFARVAKSRTLATRLVEDGHLRLNGRRCEVASKPVGPGDVLTIALERQVRVLRIVALGERRGPFREASGLFEDLVTETQATCLPCPHEATSTRERQGQSPPSLAEASKRIDLI